MRVEQNINGNTLVAQIIGQEIENFILVNNNPVFVNSERSLNGLTLSQYRMSPKRGLFHYVKYGDVLKLNQKLLEKSVK